MKLNRINIGVVIIILSPILFFNIVCVHGAAHGVVFDQGQYKVNDDVTGNYIGYKYSNTKYRLIINPIIKDYHKPLKYIDITISFYKKKHIIKIIGYNYYTNKPIKIIKKTKKNKALSFYKKYKKYYLNNL